MKEKTITIEELQAMQESQLLLKDEVTGKSKYIYKKDIEIGQKVFIYPFFKRVIAKKVEAESEVACSYFEYKAMKELNEIVNEINKNENLVIVTGEEEAICRNIKTGEKMLGHKHNYMTVYNKQNAHYYYIQSPCYYSLGAPFEVTAYKKVTPFIYDQSTYTYNYEGIKSFAKQGSSLNHKCSIFIDLCDDKLKDMQKVLNEKEKNVYANLDYIQQKNKDNMKIFRFVDKNGNSFEYELNSMKIVEDKTSERLRG